MSNSIQGSNFDQSAVAVGDGARASVSGLTGTGVQDVLTAAARLRGELPSPAGDADLAGRLAKVELRLDDLVEEARTASAPDKGRLRRALDQITENLTGVTAVAGAVEALRLAVESVLSGH